MPLRTRLIIVIVGIIAILGGIIAFVKYKPAAKPADTTPTTPAQLTPEAPVERAVVEPTVVPVGTPVKQVTTLEAEQNGVRQLAKVFVERYGSYSTDNNFQNIRDVQELVTTALWGRIGARLNTPATPAATFSAVTTVAVNTTLADWKADQATVTVKVKKTTETGGKTEESYVTVSVVMVKRNGVWLADSFKNQ